MTPSRRQFLQVATFAAALPAASRVALGQTYPTRPVRWIVPYPPGGATDLVARVLGRWLSERLGQQFIIENRPGGGTNIGVQVAVNSWSDGYASCSSDRPTRSTRLSFNRFRSTCCAT